MGHKYSYYSEETLWTYLATLSKYVGGRMWPGGEALTIDALQLERDSPSPSLCYSSEEMKHEGGTVSEKN